MGHLRVGPSSRVFTKLKQMMLNLPALALSELFVKTQMNVSSWAWMEYSALDEGSNLCTRIKHYFSCGEGPEMVGAADSVIQWW